MLIISYLYLYVSIVSIVSNILEKIKKSLLKYAKIPMCME